MTRETNKKHPLRRKDDFLPIETMAAMESVRRILESDNASIKSALKQCLVVFEQAAQTRARENLLHVEIADLRRKLAQGKIERQGSN